MYTYIIIRKHVVNLVLSVHSDQPPLSNPTTSTDSAQTLDSNPPPVASSTLHQHSYRRQHKNLSITDLGALTASRNSVAVCGVVQYFKPPTLSRGSDYFMTLGLLDETCTKECVSCTLFNPVVERLLPNVPIGEIVLLKGLKINTFHDRVQATGYKEAIIVSSSSNSGLYPLSDKEKAVMKRLKDWSNQQGIPLLSTQLSHFNVDNFFNIVCQVAAVYTSAINNCVILKVFDGTSPKFPSENLNLAQGESILRAFDRQLVLEYTPLICEVRVFDWNGELLIESGQYLSLSNVHAEFCTRGPHFAPDKTPSVKITLSPKRNNGTITILRRDESESVDNLLSNFYRPCGPFPVYAEPLGDYSEPLLSIVDEEAKKKCSIHEAFESPLGKPIVIEGQTVCFRHGPIEELCQLRCSMCKTRYVTPRPTDPPLPVKLECAFCSDSKGNSPPIKFMYVFTMQLKDDTGTLDVCVTAEDGERFLFRVSPVNLYTQKIEREKLLKLLYVLTGGNDPFYPQLNSVLDFQRPWVKCCVKKFVSIEGQTKFTLMDTVCELNP